MLTIEIWKIPDPVKAVISIGTLVLLMTAANPVEAGTFYSYINEKGTMVFTQALEEIPLVFRKSAEKIVFSDSNSNRDIKPEALFRQLKNETDAVINIRQGKKLLSSFFEDQEYMILGYILSVIAIFILLSSILKRVSGGFLSKIAIKLIMLIVLFSGFYLIYLSWLNKMVPGFNQQVSGNGGLGEQDWTDRISTPNQILERTRAAVEQINERTRLQEEALRNAGVALRHNQ